MTSPIFSGSLGFLGWYVRASWIKSEQNYSLLRWSAVMRPFLYTLCNVKAHWFMPPGKVIPNPYRWSLEDTTMEKVFPGSLKPSRQCSCCPRYTEIYIVCQVHAPDLDVGLVSPPHKGFQHNCLLQSSWYLSCLAHWHGSSECAAGTYLL